jgi:flagellar motor switch protein FliG
MGAAVQDLMVTWEDIGLIEDRQLQDVLRNVEARGLALALAGSDPETIRKIRSSISERAGAMIDEETSLMKKPKADEVEAARAAILKVLRERNAAGELSFEEK